MITFSRRFIYLYVNKEIVKGNPLKALYCPFSSFILYIRLKTIKVPFEKQFFLFALRRDRD